MISSVTSSPLAGVQVTPQHSPAQVDASPKQAFDSQPKKIRPSSNPSQLSREEQATVQKLRARDTEVRAHEQAHIAAGGQYITHGATYSYQKGPDGQRYAVGGEVGIDPSPESDPEATIRKMQVVRAAALAPANPSGQDRQVAAKASSQATRARAKLRKERAEKAEESAAPEGGQPGVEEEENVSEPGGVSPKVEHPAGEPGPGELFDIRA